MKIPEDKAVIFFDGVCNLCNDAVLFIIKRDKKNKFLFAPLQGIAGEEFIKSRNIDLTKIDSIILYEPNLAYYSKSTAALKIGKSFGGFYQILAIFEWLPASLRDAIYDIIARNRYQWFGKKEACMIPTPELQSKFMD
ncbi:thiol-disulfide oxidoreductase DCC family protein [Eudoraea chungangensis]|uniref:thiol-disulfide oxidoreductase DCC family protein n=1 Tax=Eudoraea chungangensis TaxID=1481905 RepID=UPI0023ED3330|nr:DCC1-like thiol-disulfide oxidoreductase family protein [Eudoraea chungangensis]